MATSLSSVYRRLHRIFTKPVSLGTQTQTTKNPNPLAKRQRKLKRMVEKLKQTSGGYPLHEKAVRRLASAKQFSLIENLAEHHKNCDGAPTETTMVKTLMLYGRSGMFDHARKVFDEIPKSQLTVKSFNALLGACVRSKKFDEVESLFKELPAAIGIQPDAVSYNTVIHAFCEAGSMDSAILLMDEMEKMGVEPTVISYNTLLSAFYRKGHFSLGERIWELMGTKGVAPNIRTYNSKLRGMVMEGKVVEAAELVGEMKEKGVNPDVYTFNALLKGFSENGNLEEVKKWYNELVKCGCVPDRGTFRLLVPFFCKEGELDYALGLCKEVMLGRKLVDTVTMQLVVDALRDAGKLEEASELVELGRSNKYFCYKLEL